MPKYQPVLSGDYGFDLQIDTGLATLAGYTVKMVFYSPTGALIATRTGSDGGQPSWATGRIISYTVTQADTLTPDFLFILSGHWAVYGQIGSASQLQHGFPPLIVPVSAFPVVT